MAASELKASRKLQNTAKRRSAVRLFISTAATDVNNIGTAYPGDATPIWRLLTRSSIEPEFLPGVFLIVEQYEGVVLWPYSW